MKQSEPNQKISPEVLEIIESLFKYPSLEKVFDPLDEKRYSELKQKMQATVSDLERVVRRGSNDDAAKAAKVIEAYRTSLKFLEDLDARRRS